jgi:hypothetical protein
MFSSKKLWSYNLERNFLMDGIIEWKIKIHENCKYKRKITCFKKNVSPQKIILSTCRNKSVASTMPKPFFFFCLLLLIHEVRNLNTLTLHGNQKKENDIKIQETRKKRNYNKKEQVIN